jgi:two-component system, cell cycle response regulator CtrA
MRVLLVEGDSGAGKALSAFLKAEGIIVETADTGEDALDLLRHYEFDLVLLNLLLPDMDGTTLITRMRAAKREEPVLAMAKSTNLRARLKALTAGGDDVVDQGVDRAELLARMRAIVRRSRGYSQPLLQAGTLVLDVNQQDVVTNGTRIRLSAKEFGILHLLVLRKNMVMSKDAILSAIYGGMDEPESKIIDVFVCKLRGKLAAAGLRNVIGTVWGRGYIVRDGTRGDERPPTPHIPEPTEEPRLSAAYV